MKFLHCSAEHPQGHPRMDSASLESHGQCHCLFSPHYSIILSCLEIFLRKKILSSILILYHSPGGKREPIYWDYLGQHQFPSKTLLPLGGHQLDWGAGEGEMVLHSAGSGEEPGTGGSLIFLPRKTASYSSVGVSCPCLPWVLEGRLQQCHQH